MRNGFSMIVDKMENCSLYYDVNSGLKKGFEFIKNYLKNELPVGRYDIDSDLVFAFVQSYDTLPEQEVKWETHKKYIDLQFVVKGKEIIGWTHLGELIPTMEYNEESDCTLYENQEGTLVKLKDGWFAIFFPEDAHKPKCIWDHAHKIKKIVVKIKV